MNDKLHIFEEVEDHKERWILLDGHLPVIEHDERLERKQVILTSIFNKQVFDSFNDMDFYYLSNKANVDHKRNIYFRTKEDLVKIYKDPKQQNLLILLFVEHKDKKHIPEELYDDIFS